MPVWWSVVALAPLFPVRGPGRRGRVAVFYSVLERVMISGPPGKVHTLAHASGPLKCIQTAYVSANVALGAVHWRNVDRSLATCGGQIALKAINTTLSS